MHQGRSILSVMLLLTLSDIEAAWEEEVERRVAAFARGEMPSYPAEDVFAEAHRISR